MNEGMMCESWGMCVVYKHLLISRVNLTVRSGVGAQSR